VLQVCCSEAVVCGLCVCPPSPIYILPSFDFFNSAAAMQQRGFDTLHQDMVHDAQFDFYGKRLATCSSDSLVKVWQVDAGDQYTQTGEIAMHEGPVRQVSWSHPQFGSLLATCGYDKRVMVFREASPGNWVRVFCYEGHLSSGESLEKGVSWAKDAQ